MKPTRQGIVSAISQACLDATAEKIADVVMSLYEEKPKAVPEWEQRFDGLFEAEDRKKLFREPPSAFKFFIRAEFKEIKQELICKYKGWGIGELEEVFRKRGIE